MENILEDQRMILYRGFFSGVDYEVRVDKKSGVGTIIVPSGILSHPNYKSLYLNCYRRTLTNLTTLKNIAVSLEPTNELEKERCKELMKTLPLDSEVEIVSKNKKEVNIENYLKANMITKNDNGKMVTYFKRNASQNQNEYVLENVSYFALEEELEKLFSDGRMNFEDKSVEEIANMVLDRVSNNKKQYYFESKQQHVAKDDYEKASMNATNQDDKVNTEIGIIQKDPSERVNNTYQAVERDKGHYTLAHSSVSEVESQKIEGQSESEQSITEVESREEEKVYYIDLVTQDIYDEEYQKIGNMKEGYQINFDNNHLMKNGKEIGSIGDFSSLENQISNHKNNVRTLKKDNEGIVDFQTFFLLIFIMSVLMGSLYFFCR
ncbi:MAG: hypothetical protein PUD25_04650 [Bacilli bacterium]|nr:hypothetical protein [Bacilli bacterium]